MFIYIILTSLTVYIEWWNLLVGGRLPRTSSPACYGASVGIPGHRCGDAGAAGDHKVPDPGQHLPVHPNSARCHA